ncbi:hypothetical protein LIER_08230 [Lithospermum erythrorhizon]|uniref:Uncharacterized protein n=1 Tax=Lithospermum erythrorhizon TaxID=34254 RepID=A0AAV3PB97_LITER
MDAEIIQELLGCRLSEEEATPVEVVEADLIDGLAECETSVYMKVHSHKNGFFPGRKGQGEGDGGWPMVF